MIIVSMLSATVIRRMARMEAAHDRSCRFHFPRFVAGVALLGVEQLVLQNAGKRNVIADADLGRTHAVRMIGPCASPL